MERNEELVSKDRCTLSVIQLREGDVIVLEAPSVFRDAAACERFIEPFMKAIDAEKLGVKVVVLEGGVSMRSILATKEIVEVVDGKK